MHTWPGQQVVQPIRPPAALPVWSGSRTPARGPRCH